ncbi:MAG: hypothetical protein ACPGQS_05515, partial [Bradymonadia bacterium]
MDLSVIDKLRRKPVSALTDEEQTLLLEWLLANGYEDEYQGKLASIRHLARGVGQEQWARDRTLLPKPETETEVTVQGPSMLFEHLAETPEPEAALASSVGADESTVKFRLEDQLEIPITEQHVVRDLVEPALKDEGEVRKTPSVSVDKAQLSPSDISDYSDGRTTTPVIIRPRPQPRRLETIEEPQPKIIVAPSSPNVPLSSSPINEHADLSGVEPNAPTPIPVHVYREPTQSKAFQRSDIDTGPVRTRSTTWRIFEGPRFVFFRRFFERDNRYWFIIALCFFLMLIGFGLVRTHERLKREHAKKMESASALFRTGNYSATKECFDLLASKRLEFGIGGTVLDGLLTLFT